MYRFVLWLVPTLEGFPRSQRFLLGDRMQTAAMDVLDLLVDATYSRDRQETLRRVNLGLQRLRVFARLAHDLQYLDHRRYEYASRCIDNVGRRVGAWIKRDRAPA
jgi:hypothetical protein